MKEAKERNMFYQQPNSPLNVLLLEDMEMDAELIQLQLDRMDMNIEYEHVPDKVGFHLAIQQKTYDLVISDYGLMQYTGKDAVEHLRSSDDYTAFIICTGNVNEETAVACIKAGADDYVLKENLQRLESAIMKAMEARKNLHQKHIAEEELIHLNERLSQLTHYLQNVRDEEKKKIAMEIHDQLGQELTGNKLGLYWIQQHIQQNGVQKSDQEALLERVQHLIDLNTQTIKTVRRIAHELRPVVLDDMGLIAALEWYVENFNKNDVCNCTLSIDTGNLIFNKELSTALYRIVQEGLTNVLRHSKATSCSVSLYLDDHSLHLDITDNGIGAEKKQAMESKSMGLFGMRERLKAWNGEWNLNTSPGNGTEILITIDSDKLNN
ncbi:MAG: response regulator [Flavobacteriales bacterium]|nr:response regulator [Flavobacteriales bacterium]